MYVGVEDRGKSQHDYFLHLWVTLVVLVTGIVTVGLLVMGGLNFLTGVHFLYNWVRGFTILYMISSLLSVIAFIVHVFLGRTAYTKATMHQRPWQYMQAEGAFLFMLISLVISTLFLLAM